jgi:hypothetical protein
MDPPPNQRLDGNEKRRAKGKWTTKNHKQFVSPVESPILLLDKSVNADIN